jgi:hypothetical protein
MHANFSNAPMFNHRTNNNEKHFSFLEELWTNRHYNASCESGKVFCSGFKSLRIQDFLKLP